MTPLYGIRVSKPGYDVKTATDPQLVFDSRFNTLKIKQQGTGTLTDSSRTVTIAHNLGYVPAFMVHTQFNNGGNYYITPLVNTQPSFFPANNGNILAWADSTNLYIEAQSGVGYSDFLIQNETTNNAYATESSFFGYQYGFWAVGQDSYPATLDGAIRFGNVNIPQGLSISKAIFNIKITHREGSGQVNTNIYGIAEDNTGNFDSGTPATARTKTSSVTASNTNHLNNDIWSVDVTSQVQEIVNRSGWSSGNFMGFIMDDNATTGTNFYEDDGGGSNVTNLSVLLNSNLASFHYSIFYNKII